MKTIWIVDDDEEIIRAVQLMLKLLDCETLYFFSARPAAQALLDGERPDLFILDINMPGVSGIDFLEFLRRRKDLKNIPVVMLSTEAADVTVDQAMALGADAYVTKPVALDELEEAKMHYLFVSEIMRSGSRTVNDLRQAIDDFIIRLSALNGQEIDILFTIEADNEIKLHPLRLLNYYRIVRETAFNALRNTGATIVNMVVQISENENFCLTVRDNGHVEGDAHLSHANP